jgi:RNA polymerase sigma factor for flagellar operon FliA
VTLTANSTHDAPVYDAPVYDREQAIMEHLPQVRLIARRIHDRLPGNVSLEDLVSAGTVGLISAIDRYDASVGVKLRTYAEYKIRGAILDSLRELDWAPRRQRRRARQLQEAIAAVEQRTHRNATSPEIASELGISIEECQEWMADARTLNVTQLETTTIDDDGRDMMRQIADTSDNLPCREIERSALQKVLAQSLERMPLPERTVLTLYYHEGLNLREISRVMDLHESRISQLKIQALARLRIVIEKQWPQKGTEVKPLPNRVATA